MYGGNGKTFVRMSEIVHDRPAGLARTRLPAGLERRRIAVGVFRPDDPPARHLHRLVERALDERLARGIRLRVRMPVAQVDHARALEPVVHRRHTRPVPATPGEPHVNGTRGIDLWKRPQERMRQHHVRYICDMILPLATRKRNARNGDLARLDVRQGRSRTLVVPVKRQHSEPVLHKISDIIRVGRAASSVNQKQAGESAFRRRACGRGVINEELGIRAAGPLPFDQKRLHPRAIAFGVGVRAKTWRLEKRLPVPEIRRIGVFARTFRDRLQKSARGDCSQQRSFCIHSCFLRGFMKC